MKEQLDGQREQLEDGFKEKETVLWQELLDTQHQTSRLRCYGIQLLHAEQLAALQGEIQGALQRVARMQLRERRVAEATVLHRKLHCQM
jgi:hypothetical protein